MTYRNSKRKTIIALLCFIVFMSVNLGQASSKEDANLPEEFKKAKNTIEDFLQDWRNKDYKAMYQRSSKAFQKKNSEDKFTRKYQKYGIANGQIVQHSLLPPSMAKLGKMVIRVEVETSEDIAKNNNIVKSVEFTLNTDKEKTWKIDKIHIPIPLITKQRAK